MMLSAVSFAKSKSKTILQKSSLRGTEKNTLPLSNGLRVNLIHKREDGDSEALELVCYL
uniref:Uncharacterized protein n=1 Tax=Peromyscus maniculatus bairdii TaxID=230844 RepID=A0A8C8US07_PERMB